MGLEFRFTLDGSVMTSPPKNWEAFEIRQYYRDDVRGIVTSFTNNLKFEYEGFNVLYGKILANEYCDYVPFLVEYTTDETTYQTLFSGNIHIVDTDFDLIRRECEFRIQDTTFSSLIFENKDFLLTTGQEESKNGAVISKTTFEEVAAAGVYIIEYGQLLQYILDYITDEQVQLSDNWYPTLNDYGLGVGFQERIGFATTPNSGSNGEIDVTFENIFSGIAAIYNLNFSLVWDAGDEAFKFNVDGPATFRSNTTAITISGFTRFFARNAKDNLFSSVKVGDKEMQKSVTSNSLDYHVLTNPVFHHDPIDIQLRGQCNIGGKILDLQPGFAYGGTTPGFFLPLATQNPFMYLVTYNTGSETYALTLDQYDETVTRLTYTAGDPVILTTSFSGPTSLTNEIILSRYILPNNSYLSTKPDVRYDYSVDLTADSTVFGTFAGASGYRVMETTTGCNLVTATFVDNRLMLRDNLEAIESPVEVNCSNYGIALLGSSARVHTYNTTGSIDIQINSGVLLGTNIEVQLWFRRGGVNYVKVLGTFTGDSSDTGNISWDFDFNSDSASDEIRFIVFSDEDQTETVAKLLTGSTWNLTQLDGNGEDIINVDTDNFKGYEIEFETNVSLTSWQNLFQDPRKRIALNLFNEPTKYAWIKDVTYKPAKGSFSGLLITDYNNLNFP